MPTRSSLPHLILWHLITLIVISSWQTSLAIDLHARVEERSAQEMARRSFMSVCPPFHLLTEDGAVIDPSKDMNTDKPYSPKKTCGRCHDYDRITSGYHFQQGKDERVSSEMAAIYPWMRSPGQYGGRY